VIEKFNFYDVYGYFLPGLTLLGILWLPFGLVGQIWPPSGWSSAIVVGASAYILGHLLQRFVATDLPSKIRQDSGSDLRYPSDIALDSDSELPTELRSKIGMIAKEQFDLDLCVNQTPTKEIDKRRNSAFLLARQVLIREKAVSYAEQFQGMYALMRGLSVAFGVAFAYWLGWAASILRSRILLTSGVLILTIALLLLINVSVQLVYGRTASPLTKEPRWWIFVRHHCSEIFLIAFFTTGYVAGLNYVAVMSHGALLSFLAALAFLASLRTYDGYRYFAGRFASTVWRDFLAYNAKILDSSAAPNKAQNPTQQGIP
jgi:hypothetical protein